jgi:hypothetical protein
MALSIKFNYSPLARPRRAFGALSGALAGLLLLAGCSPTTVTQVSQDSAALPQPVQVLVYDFAVSADEVQLDKGLSAELEQKYDDEMSGPARTADEIRVGHSVANVVAQELVNKIRSYGLQAERAYADTPLGEDSLLIRGVFVSIDEGNRTERVAIGFGAGRTQVQADVQVYELTPSGEQRVETLDASGGSNDKPGMLEMMAIGALTHHLATATVVSGTISAAGEVTFETVQADGKRLADKIAADLGEYFVSQGWVNPGAIQ